MFTQRNPVHQGRPLSLAAVLAQQGAKYDQKEIPECALFHLYPAIGAALTEAFGQLTSQHFGHNAVEWGGELPTEDFSPFSGNLFRRMSENGQTLLIAGAGSDWMRAIQEHWTEHFIPYRVTAIADSPAPFENDVPDNPMVKGIHLVGSQRQLMQYNKVLQLETVRLGEYRAQPNLAEPFLRSSEFVYFDLNAIRYSDCPANSAKHPGGLTAEEASALARVAGMSERTQCMVISAWNPVDDPYLVTARLVAQLFWYFLEGRTLRQLDQGLQRSQLTQYQVQLMKFDRVLNFYKSEHTGKWWYEEPLSDNAFSNQLIPCTLDEYQMAAQDQIPQRILDRISG
ncbi:MAG: hypothetical protein KBF37_06475 [Saprospiraceae bacterium]|jgi:hypothetical protein|nr:hypothetical protein [Saprospiraceae bacterium]